jgi:hypothetical protein
MKVVASIDPFTQPLMGETDAQIEKISHDKQSEAISVIGV